VKDEEAPFEVGENEAEGSRNEQNFSVRMKCSGDKVVITKVAEESS
jgi:hypothetical protein